jgi:hypothetical protein
MPYRDRRHLETLAGRGWISLDGVRLSDVTYHIDVWQQFVTTSPGRALPAARQLAGTITDYRLDGVDLFDRLVRLHLETGGHLDCFLDGNRVKSVGAPLTTSH